MHTQTSLCLCVNLIFTAGRNKKTLERRSTAEEENYDPRTQRSDVCIATRPTPYQVSGLAAGSAPRQAEKKRHDRPHIRQVPGRRLENREGRWGKRDLAKLLDSYQKHEGRKLKTKPNLTAHQGDLARVNHVEFCFTFNPNTLATIKLRGHSVPVRGENLRPALILYSAHRARP